MLFNYPPAALLSRKIAKEKIYQAAKANAKTREEFAGSIKQIRRQQAEVKKLQARLKREKQYNRKLELNAELSAAMRQLKTLEKR